MTVALGGDKSKIMDRKVTLETGRVAFWNAVAQLCEKADLVDADGVLVPVPPISVPINVPPVQIQPIQPIQIQPIQIQPIQIQPIKIRPALPAQPAPAQKEPEKIPTPKEPVKDAPKKEEAPKPVQPVQPAPPAVQPVQPAVPPVAAVRAPLIRRPVGGPVNNPRAIVLVDGKTRYPSYGENSVRVRALPMSAAQNQPFPQPEANEIGLVINLTAEPRIQLEQFLGVKIDKCLDNYKQELAMAMTAPDAPQVVNGPNIQIRQQIQINGGVVITTSSRALSYGPNFFPIRLKKGEKEALTIKELTGIASVKMRTQEENLIIVENILKAKGESTKGKGDCDLAVLDVTKGENGEYTIDVELGVPTEVQPSVNNVAPVRPNPPIIRNPAQPAPANPAPALQPAFRPVFHNTGLELQDEKGKAYVATRVQYTKNVWQQNRRTISVKLTFKADNEQGEPAKLVFKGTRLASAEIPFVLKDIPVK